MNRLTLAGVSAELRKLNMVIRKRDGEYRVTFSNTEPGYETNERREAVAYYTDDLQDALNTAWYIRNDKDNCDKALEFYRNGGGYVK